MHGQARRSTSQGGLAGRAAVTADGSLRGPLAHATRPRTLVRPLRGRTGCWARGTVSGAGACPRLLSFSLTGWVGAEDNVQMSRYDDVLEHTMSFPCPCCGHLTVGDPPPGTYEVCSVCYWEDDPVQFYDPTYAGGANEVSLERARRNYMDFGACEKQFLDSVRAPRDEEKPK